MVQTEINETSEIIWNFIKSGPKWFALFLNDSVRDPKVKFSSAA